MLTACLSPVRKCHSPQFSGHLGSTTLTSAWIGRRAKPCPGMGEALAAMAVWSMAGDRAGAHLGLFAPEAGGGRWGDQDSPWQGACALSSSTWHPPAPGHQLMSPSCPAGKPGGRHLLGGGSPSAPQPWGRRKPCLSPTASKPEPCSWVTGGGEGSPWDQQQRHLCRAAAFVQGDRQPPIPCGNAATLCGEGCGARVEQGRHLETGSEEGRDLDKRASGNLGDTQVTAPGKRSLGWPLGCAPTPRRGK